jgi:hypothetical protein
MFYCLNQFHRLKVNAESRVCENDGHAKGINETIDRHHPQHFLTELTNKNTS